MAHVFAPLCYCSAPAEHRQQVLQQRLRTLTHVRSQNRGLTKLSAVSVYCLKP